MVLPPRIRRQRQGVKVQQTTISLPGDDMEWLRKQAFAEKITVSLYVRNLVQQFRQNAGRERDDQEEAA